MKKNKFDIIIPTFNQESYTIQCLKSIRDTSKKDDYRIIWIDNGSSCDSRLEVMREIRNHNYLSVWLENRVGFVKAVNKGINVSNAEYIVILNNDTILATKDWLNIMTVPFKKEEDIMLVGVNTTKNTSRQAWNLISEVDERFKDMPNLEGYDIEGIANILWNKYYDIYYDINILAFFCVMARRKIFDMIGLLDEEYEEGYSDDVDFSIKVKKAGFRLVYMPGVYVHHFNRTTFLSLYNSTHISYIMRRNKQILRRKHGTS